MFRDKPSAYERLADAIGDIGDRIGELEEQVVERFSPTPTVPERLRRAVTRHLPSRRRSFAERYLPEFASHWSLPTLDDAKSSYNSLRGALPDLRGSLSDLRNALPAMGASLPALRNSAATLRDRLPEARLPDWRPWRRPREASSTFAYLRDRPGLTTLLIAGGVLAVGGLAFYVTKKVADHTEEPDYDVVRKDGDIEIRDYDAMVVAETVKSGYHEKALRAGFHTLADYISANNRSGKKIAMTAPVLQQLSESEGAMRGWAIRFVMPKKFARSALPQPSNEDVALKDIGSKRVVAVRFSGKFSASLASKKLMTLYNYLADENLKQKGDPEYAFYNPPLTPGFLRRNEILIEIER